MEPFATESVDKTMEIIYLIAFFIMKGLKKGWLGPGNRRQQNNE
jgi:hypothetical protein